MIGCFYWEKWRRRKFGLSVHINIVGIILSAVYITTYIKRYSNVIEEDDFLLIEIEKKWMIL